MATVGTTRGRTLLRALGHRNYRLFFAGQFVSLVGTWRQALAMSWLVYRLTGSAFFLGVVNCAGQAPSFFLAPLAGVLSDRANQHRVLLVTQTLAMLQALALAGLTLSGAVAVWQVVLLSACLGCVNAFDMTTRQAILPRLVTRPEDLANAVALNSSLVNGARLFGPSLAGLVIAAAGEGACFLLNGLSYLAVLAALLALDLPPWPRPAARRHVLADLREGFLYTFGFAPVRALILLLALVSFVGLPYTVLMPVFAQNVLHGGPETLGYLMAASGVGALAGAVFLASRSSVLGLGRLITAAPAVFGLALTGFAVSERLWLSLPLLLVTGMAMMVQLAASNTILQTVADPDKRGRVMSFYTMAFMGVTPLGSLLAGVLSDVIGAPRTLLLCGVCCVAGSLVFARQLPRLREATRPVYRRLGILPEVARDLPATPEPAGPLGP